MEGVEEEAEEEAKAEVEDEVVVEAEEGHSLRQPLRTVITLPRNGPAFLMSSEKKFIRRELISAK